MAAGATSHTHRTRGGVTVDCRITPADAATAVDDLARRLDTHRGVLLASSYEYPGRYKRWDIGFVDPPLMVTASADAFRVTALNARGEVLLASLAPRLRATEHLRDLQVGVGEIAGTVPPAPGTFAEEERSHQPSVFSALRAIREHFSSPEDGSLGLYGAFGYDLVFQFEALTRRLTRSPRQRDLVLYLPDELLVVDHYAQEASRRSYEFAWDGGSTQGLSRAADPQPATGAAGRPRQSDSGRFLETVGRAHDAFARGDLFEVTPSQTFDEPCSVAPSTLFTRLRRRNPAPYGFLVNLGDAEYLIGASPEMFVRVEGRRVETCPIAGTIARGDDALADAAQILALLSSEKDAAELTMCTDVDRNDKARVCEPGSVRVIGRRQIELYAKVIHTVDHVEGRLREGFDSIDAFLTHLWAVTVTGAPKLWAMQFIEDHEESPREWYGGAVGMLGFDGNLNTGLTLRTIHLRDGVARVRAGASLLLDSDPQAEELETRVKASALLDAIRRPDPPASVVAAPASAPRHRPRVLLVDHQDSFVHTLGDYLRQSGAEVVTLRSGFNPAELDRRRPDLVVLSPGPGTPATFGVAGTVGAALERNLPVFGVCLGLQGIVEHFGGRLRVLKDPMHGKASQIHVLSGEGGPGRLLDGLPSTFRAGRYHSLYIPVGELPAPLRATAETSDGVTMAVEHRDLPVAAVQFHPESIMTMDEQVGALLLRNVVQRLIGSGTVSRATSR